MIRGMITLRARWVARDELLGSELALVLLIRGHGG
jgi:hypothetical protein